MPRWALSKAAADLIFAAKPGKVVGPIATTQGFHLYLVEALPEPALDETTAAVLRREIFDEWLAEQLRDAQIDLSVFRPDCKPHDE